MTFIQSCCSPGPADAPKLCRKGRCPRRLPPLPAFVRRGERPVKSKGLGHRKSSICVFWIIEPAALASEVRNNLFPPQISRQVMGTNVSAHHLQGASFWGDSGVRNWVQESCTKTSVLQPVITSSEIASGI